MTEDSEKVFKFYVNKRHPSLKYETNLESEQCRHIKPNGEHCNRIVTIGVPLCSQHLMMTKHLKIQKSTIPKAGKGVFAFDPSKGPNTIIFRGSENTGQLICMFDGEIITKAQLNRRYRKFTAPYAVEISDNRYEDAAKRRGVGSLINHSDDPAKINCRLGIRHHKIAIFATKNIKNNKELFCNYGEEYSFYESTHYSTR